MLQSTEKGRECVSFLQEYSAVGEDLNRERTLRMARQKSSLKPRRQLEAGGFLSAPASSPLKAAGNDLTKLFKQVQGAKEPLAAVSEPSFSVLEFSRRVER